MRRGCELRTVLIASHRVGIATFGMHVLLAAMPVIAVPRVWIADQGNNQQAPANPNNRILEIDPINLKTPPDPDGTNVIILNTVPSPAGAFLDELTFDNQERLWTVVKEQSDQEPDGIKRIDRDTGAIQVTYNPQFPFEGLGNLVYLEGLAWDVSSTLWLSGVRQTGQPNVLTRIDPDTGNAVAPFDTGAGYVEIPGNVCQGLLFEDSGGGFLWHSDVVQQKIYKLDIANSFAVVKTFNVPFPPKGMDFYSVDNSVIWVASPNNGIWRIETAAADNSNGNATKFFNTPNWNLDGLAVLPEPGPFIQIAPDSIAVSTFIGTPAAGTSFTIKNLGTGKMDYTIDDSAITWADASPNTGRSSGETDVILLNLLNTDTFDAGEYSGDLIVTSPQALNSPITLSVLLTVETVGPDLDGDADVDMNDFARLQACFRSGSIPAECESADFDQNNAIGAAELGIFINCLTGPGLPATQGCDQ